MNIRWYWPTLSLGVVLPVLIFSPAWARPRDEVMSGAFRCATIGDSRTWLDCYYGAAQPARAALGLKPAPAAQVALVASPPAGSPTGVAVRDAVMASAFQCGGFSEDRSWLECYYAAAQPMRAALGLPAAAPAKSAPGLPQASAVEMPDRQFGLPPRPAPATGENQVSSRMTAYSFDKFGLFTITLENGQVWRQVNGDTDYAHWKKPPASYSVRITHGFLNSFNLQVKDNPGLFKVLRVR